MNSYLKYRGKCKKLCEAAIAKDPTLKLVRGHYYDAIWGSDEQHWWTERLDGTIYDPSCKQFPTNGKGVYTKFNGICMCEECGKEVLEEHAQIVGNYPVCSTKCALKLVGL